MLGGDSAVKDMSMSLIHDKFGYESFSATEASDEERAAAADGGTEEAAGSTVTQLSVRS